MKIRRNEVHCVMKMPLQFVVLVGTRWSEEDNRYHRMYVEMISWLYYIVPQKFSPKSPKSTRRRWGCYIGHSLAINNPIFGPVRWEWICVWFGESRKSHQCDYSVKPSDFHPGDATATHSPTKPPTTPTPMRMMLRLGRKLCSPHRRPSRDTTFSLRFSLHDGIGGDDGGWVRESQSPKATWYSSLCEGAWEPVAQTQFANSISLHWLGLVPARLTWFRPLARQQVAHSYAE